MHVDGKIPIVVFYLPSLREYNQPSDQITMPRITNQKLAVQIRQQSEKFDWEEKTAIFPGKTQWAHISNNHPSISRIFPENFSPRQFSQIFEEIMHFVNLSKSSGSRSVPEQWSTFGNSCQSCCFCDINTGKFIPCLPLLSSTRAFTKSRQEQHFLQYDFSTSQVWTPPKNDQQ